MTCKISVNNVVMVTDWTLLDSTDEEIIKKHLYKTGPLTIVLHVNTV